MCLPNNPKIAFTVTIYDAELRRQNFGQVNNACYPYIIMKKPEKNYCVTILGEDFSHRNSSQYSANDIRARDEWKFNANRKRISGLDLPLLCANYGIDVDEIPTGGKDMSVSLQKGSKVSLSKANAGVSPVNRRTWMG